VELPVCGLCVLTLLVDRSKPNLDHVYLNEVFIFVKLSLTSANFQGIK